MLTICSHTNWRGGRVQEVAGVAWRLAFQMRLGPQICFPCSNMGGKNQWSQFRTVRLEFIVPTVNRYRNIHDSYRLKYRSLLDYTGRTAEYRTSRPKNGYRAVLKTWRKWKKLAAENSRCRPHWLFSHVVGHSPSLPPSVLSSRFTFFFFFFFFCFFCFFFSFDRYCSSCAFCFSCVGGFCFFFFFFGESVCGSCLFVLCEF